MDRLIEWLPPHIPPDDETTIVHGDFRLDNAIFHPTEPRVLALLDWELSTLGHPLSDFAYNAMAWRLSSEEFRGLKGEDLARWAFPPKTNTSPRTAAAPGETASRTGSSTSSSTCSGSPRSCMACSCARCKETPRARMRSRPAAARARSPRSHGRWRKRSMADSRGRRGTPHARKRSRHGLCALAEGRRAAGAAYPLHGNPRVSGRAGVRCRGRGQSPARQPVGCDRSRRGAEASGARGRIVEPLPARNRNTAPA